MKTTQEFLNTLFPDFGNGFIEVRTIHPADNDVQSHFYESHDRLSRGLPGLESLSKDCNVYFGVCPRSRKEGTKDAVKFVWCLWIDLDAKSFEGGKDQSLARLREFPLPPSIIVDSGNGYHAYWRLKEAEEITGPADIVRVEAYLKALASALNGDLQAAELARILRIPGTQNLKNPAAPLIVVLVECEPDRQYNLSDLDAYLTMPITVPQVANKSGWIAEALTTLTEGNRNATFAKIAGRLNKDGFEPEEIVALLSAHAQMSGFPLEELRRIVKGIYRRYPAKTSSPSFSHNSETTETESKPMEAIPLAKFMEGETPNMDWLVERILPKEGVAIVAGPAGYGKSWMLLDLAIKYSQGGKWLDHFQTQKGRVFYLDEESSPGLLRRRLRKLLGAKDIQENTQDVHFTVGQGLCLTDPKSVERLRGLLESLRPTLVIIDSLIRVHRAEENSATEMSRVFAVVKALVRDFGCSFLFADHQKKPGQYGGSLDLLLRGSTEKAAFVDTLLSLQKKGGSLIVEHSKSRYDEAVPAFVVSIEDKTPETTNVFYAGEAEALKRESRMEAAKEFLALALQGGEWVARKALIEQAKAEGVFEKALDETLKALETEGRVDRENRKPEGGRGGKTAFYRWKSDSSPSLEQETETETK